MTLNCEGMTSTSAVHAELSSRAKTDAYKTVRAEGVKGNLTTKLSQLRCGINEAVRHIKDNLMGNSLRKNISL